MKRMKMEHKPKHQPKDLEIGMSESVVDYISGLKLLCGVPFSYLVTEEQMLPPESIRFFYVDGNWTKALTEGALSIGQVCLQEARESRMQLNRMGEVAHQCLHQVRLRKMHENHRRGVRLSEVQTESEALTGFLMRSVLVRRMKGLEVSGSCGEKPLSILRMESLSEDIMLCIFDGEITRLVIAEPKVGLRFGCPDTTRILRVRSVTDDATFGKYLEDTIDVNEYTEGSGRLDVVSLAGKFEKILGTEVGAAKLAYELIATAHRGEFRKK